jgi:hypothetical protein
MLETSLVTLTCAPGTSYGKTILVGNRHARRPRGPATTLAMRYYTSLHTSLA